ncbi:hypothetical protein ANANG_G00177340, partial [Anguilla anguilla]
VLVRPALSKWHHSGPFSCARSPPTGKYHHHTFVRPRQICDSSGETAVEFQGELVGLQAELAGLLGFSPGRFSMVLHLKCSCGKSAPCTPIPKPPRSLTCRLSQHQYIAKCFLRVI